VKCTGLIPTAIPAHSPLSEHLDEVVYLLLMSVMMRASYNLELMMNSDLFDSLLRLVKIVLVSYPAQLAINVKHYHGVKPGDERFEHTLLQVVIASSFKVIVSALNGPQSWREVAVALRANIPHAFLAKPLPPNVIIVKRNVVRSGMIHIVTSALPPFSQR
jgi:hypothetical protein